MAGGDAEPGRLMPSASPIELIVLAVNMPPHAPSPGQARALDLVELLGRDRTGGAGADGLEHVVTSIALPACWPGMIEPL